MNNINNHYYNLRSAAHILDHVESSALLLPHLIDELKAVSFMDPLAGFLITNAPLYTLACLLHEGWATEDVLNARGK